MRKLTFITSNRGKFEELRVRLDAVGIDSTQKTLRYPEVQAKALLEVVESGLRWLLQDAKVKGPFLIEDSGLFVSALGGFPGVYSAHAFDTIGNAGILALLGDKQDRSAHFESTIGYVDADGKVSCFVGVCHGQITLEPKGSDGFGFDPIFRAEGQDRTFAEMEAKEKSALSHRGMAGDRLVNHLLTKEGSASKK